MVEQIVRKEKLYDELETREIAMCSSGSDVYGTSTSESDIDLRGYWVQKKEFTLGVIKGLDTFERKTTYDGHVYDIVLHEIEKFSGLFMKCNPNVVEWVYGTHYWRYPTIMPEFVQKLQTVGLTNEKSFYLGLFGWVKFYMKHTPLRVKSLLDIMRISAEAEVYHNKHQITTNICLALDEIENKNINHDDYIYLMDMKRQGVESVEQTDKIYNTVMDYFSQTQKLIKVDDIIIDNEIKDRRRNRINELVIKEREDEYYYS